MACTDGGGHRCLGARLQGVSIQTHRGLAHAGAVFLDLVNVIQHRECGLAHKWCVEWLHHAGGTHTNNSTRLVVEHVIDVDLALDNRGPGVDRLGQRVQRVAQDLRLDLLQIMGNVENRHGLQGRGVGFWIAGKVHKWDIGCWQIAHNVVARTHAADLAQLGDTVPVIVHPRIRLNVQHALHHGVGRVVVARDVVQWLTRQKLLVGVQVVGGQVVAHLILVIAHGDQIGHGQHLAVRNQGSIFKGPCPAINHQLLGRHGHDPHAPIFDNALDLHVMDHGHGRCWLACCHCLRVDLVDHLLGDGRVRVRHNDLDLGIFLGQDLQGLVIKA